MKKKTTPIRLGVLAYLLILPAFLLINCQNDLDDPALNAEAKLTPDAKVLSLMKEAIISSSDYLMAESKESLSKSTDLATDDQCTHFLYPMTFEVYSGDNPNPTLWEINSDEELLEFIDTLVAAQTTYQYYIYFPITLLDTDGNETVLNDLTELEGTLSMAVEACAGMNDGSPDGGSDDGTGGGSDDGTGGGTDDGTGGSSDGGSDDGSNGGSGDGSDDGSDDSSGGSSDDGSDDGSDNGSDDGSDDGSDGGSDDGSDDDSSDDSSGDDSGDDDDSDEEDFAESSEGSNGYQYCDKNGKKVLICHKGNTICISVNAIWGHMQHHEEDYFGSCVD